MCFAPRKAEKNISQRARAASQIVISFLVCVWFKFNKHVRSNSKSLWEFLSTFWKAWLVLAGASSLTSGKIMLLHIFLVTLRGRGKSRCITTIEKAICRRCRLFLQTFVYGSARLFSRHAGANCDYRRAARTCPPQAGARTRFVAQVNLLLRDGRVL